MRTSKRPRYLLPLLLLAASILAPVAPGAAAEQLQGHVLAGRSVRAMAAAPAATPGATAAASGNAAEAAANAAGASAAKAPSNEGIAIGKDSGIDGVRVTIASSRKPGETVTTTTDRDGRFSLDGLAAGAYRVTFAHGVLGERSVQALVGKGAGDLEFVWEVGPARPPAELPMPAGR